MDRKFIVDLPQVGGDWKEVAVFATKAEAVQWIEKNIGACTSDGYVGLITEVEDATESDVICMVNVETAFYVGSVGDGVFFEADSDANGQWFMTAVTDSDTGSFAEPLATDVGPHDTYREALETGLLHAKAWCLDNGVKVNEKDLADVEGRIHAL